MATSTLQANSSNDLFLPDGKNLIVISGTPACSQNILQATLLRLGEDIYNTLNGIDYLGLIFTSQPSISEAQQAISDAILACPDVTDIESLTVTISGNTFNYVALVNTIYGTLPVSNI